MSSCRLNTWTCTPNTVALFAHVPLPPCLDAPGSSAAPRLSPFFLAEMDQGDTDCGAAHRQLPTAVQLHILSLLTPNDRALSGRLVSPDARDAFSGAQHCTASLSEPLVAHAAARAVAAGQQYVLQLPFWHKLQLLCTAAASGCEVNLAVALEVLQPSVFAELLQPSVVPGLLQLPIRNTDRRVFGANRSEDSHNPDAWRERRVHYDPGQAAVKAGHPDVLGWLARRCPGLLRPQRVLEAAARHCSLAGLQTAYEALQGSVNSGGAIGRGGLRQMPSQGMLDEAAASATPDYLAKMEWILSLGGPNCRLQESTAEAAARSGDLHRLQYLRSRGCPMGGDAFLKRALMHADLGMAQWLVDEAVCHMPQAMDEWGLGQLLFAAAHGSDGVAKLQWLQARGILLGSGDEDELLRMPTMSAIMAGCTDVLSYLIAAFGTSRAVSTWARHSGAAAGSGSIAMVECLRDAGAVFGSEAFNAAGRKGDLAMVRWLAGEARASLVTPERHLLPALVLHWPRRTAADSRGLLEAVQVVVGAGLCDWGGFGNRLWMEVVKWGNLALLQYLQQQQQQQSGQRSDSSIMAAAAAQAGCEALLEWLAEQPGGLASPPSSTPAESLYVAPAARGDRATLTALRRLGVPWGAEDVVARAVNGFGQAPALRWLVEQGAPVGSAAALEEAVAKAVRRRSLSAADAEWLRGLAA